MNKRNAASLGLALALFLPLAGLAQTTGRRIRQRFNYTESTAKRLKTDPRFKFSLASHYFNMDGHTYARENAQERYYSSSDMKSLDLADNLGLDRMMVYNAAFDYRASRRNHITVNYLMGFSEGQGRIGYETGFNDNLFSSPGLTDGELQMDSLQIGWYYRAYDTAGKYGRYSLDLGAGAMYLREYISFDTEAEESSVGLATEDIRAPFVPYYSVAGRWQSNWRLGLGMDIKAAPAGVQTTLLSELPANAFFYSCDFYSTFAIGGGLSLTAGVNYWNMELDFDGVETNHLNHVADNEVEMSMTGAYIGMTFDDPQIMAANALRRLFR